MGKVYVTVFAKFAPDGKITPLRMVWTDGRRYEIDRVLDVRRAASLKVGGTGIRYTVRILGQERFLYLDDNRWFVEGDQACAEDM